MRQNEQKMLSVLRANNKLSDLVEAEDQYSFYDACNDNVIIELKYRYPHKSGAKFNDTMIEYYKYDKNINHTKDFLYVVRRPDDNKLYLFHINRLVRDNYDFKWSNRWCNKQTEFNANHKITKKVGYISWDQADRIYDME